MFGFLLGVLVGVLRGHVFAQSSRAVQDLVESLGSQEAAEALAAELDYLRANPLNLNRVSAAELAGLPWISNALADAIVRYRDEHGKFGRLADLVTAGLLDASTADLLAPYVFVGQRASVRTGRVRVRAEKRATRVVKPAWRRLARLQVLRWAGVSAGAVAEGDPGEERVTDFLATYVAVRPGGGLVVVAGDYSVQLGQGLLFASPYPPIVGPDIERLSHEPARPLRGYVYGDESFALRGLAVWRESQRVQVLGFASRRLRDGAVDSNSGEIRLVETGYHRTERERSWRRAVLERVVGASARWKPATRAAVRATLAVQRLEAGATRAARTATAVEARCRWAGTEFFGETAWMLSGMPSWLGGLRVSATGFEGLFLAHRYGPGLTEAFRSNPLEGERTGAEQNGALAALRLGNSQRGLTAVAGQVARRGQAGPEQRFLLDAWTRVGRAARLGLRLQDRWREVWTRSTDGAGRERSDSRTLRTRRVRAQLDLGRGRLVAQIRGAFVWAGGAAPGSLRAPDGKLVYEQLRWYGLGGVDVVVRFAVFDVRSNTGAVYAYEPGLPGAFAIRRYGGCGWRTVLVARFRLGPLRAAVKLARTEEAATEGARSGTPAGWDVGLQVDGEIR